MKPSISLAKAPSSTAPPHDLAEPERELWTRLVAAYALHDAAALVLLDSLCRNRQLARQCRERVDADGLIVDGRAHPLLRTLESAEKLTNAALKALNLDLEPLKAAPGRPAQPFGFKGS